MTRKALEKLNEKQLKYCETMSVLIARDRSNGEKEKYEKDSGKLRGFLECIMQMGTIKPSEMKELYLYFFTEERK